MIAPPTAIAAAALTAIAVAALLVAQKRESQFGTWLTKPIASAGFILAAGFAAGAWDRFSVTILIALMLSLVGDVFLIPRSDKWFQAGLFAFLSAHLAFIVSFVLREIDWRGFAVAAVVVAALAVAIARWLIPKVQSGLRYSVIAYMAVISAMVALSVGTFTHQRNWLIPIAAIAFFCSDLSVARDSFVARRFANRAWGLPLYYAAQLAFAFSLVGG